MLSMTKTPRDEMIANHLPWIAVVVLVLGATIVRIRFGWPAVLLWLAFCALSGAILLFWEALRAALDPNSRGDENDLDHRALALAELEERKRAALRALRDVQQEYALGKLSDEDARALEERYRSEARQVMQALDDLLGEHLSRAEAEFDRLARAILESNRNESELADREKSSERLHSSEGTAKPEPVEERERKRFEASSAQQDERIECSACNTLNDSDARFCKSCGTPIKIA